MTRAATLGAPVWPRTPKMQPFYVRVQHNRDAILKGRMLCLDPATGATSLPGWALYVAGKLVDSGVIQPQPGATHQRLRDIFWKVHDREDWDPLDLVVVEQLRGSMVAPQLHWATGVLLAACVTEVVLEIPIKVWKSVSSVDPNYRKSDEADARAMGQAVVLLAQHGVGLVAGMAGGMDTDDGPAPARRRQRPKRSPTRRTRGVRSAPRTARGRTRKAGKR